MPCHLTYMHFLKNCKVKLRCNLLTYSKFYDFFIFTISKIIFFFLMQFMNGQKRFHFLDKCSMLVNFEI